MLSPNKDNKEITKKCVGVDNMGISSLEVRQLDIGPNSYKKRRVPTANNPLTTYEEDVYGGLAEDLEADVLSSGGKISEIPAIREKMSRIKGYFSDHSRLSQEPVPRERFRGGFGKISATNVNYWKNYIVFLLALSTISGLIAHKVIKIRKNRTTRQQKNSHADARWCDNLKKHGPGVGKNFQLQADSTGRQVRRGGNSAHGRSF